MGCLSIPQWCDCCLKPDTLMLSDDPAFNPTMVRLLRAFDIPTEWNLYRFQSHNGAIAAVALCVCGKFVALLSIPQWCDCCRSRTLATVPSERAFNPTMVRLLLNPLGFVVCVTHLSIPQWCDCCLDGYIEELIERMNFQSHNGAIAA